MPAILSNRLANLFAYIILPTTGIKTEYNFDILESVRLRANDFIFVWFFYAGESFVSISDKVSVRHLSFLFQVTS